MINYDENKNCFAKTSGVVSHLLKDSKGIEAPYITIFIPTYKRAGFLRDSLFSALSQHEIDCSWDILVLDNEAYDGEVNETEKVVRSFDSDRIVYYRNSDNLAPGDNFNRGFLLARGPWIMMLHDDDLLMCNALRRMVCAINFLRSLKGKPLGAIAAQYERIFDFGEKYKDIMMYNVKLREQYYLSRPMSLTFWKHYRDEILFTSHPGGDLPSNGSVFNKEAVLSIGGFDLDWGISGDLIMFPCLSKKYRVYHTREPYGFYRMHNNVLSRTENKYEIIRCVEDFRKYVYSKNIFTKIWGKCFSSYLSHLFVADFFPELINEICIPRVSKIRFKISRFICRVPLRVRNWETKRLSKKFKKWKIMHAKNI